MQHLVLASIVLSAVTCSPAFAADWPQWLGPNRDSVWRETGIVDEFPEDGPPVRWRTPVGLGYAGPAVAGDRVFVTDFVKKSGEITNNAGTADRLEGTERVLCLDANTGEVLWKHEVDRVYELSYPGGPRCTPTVDGDRVYALGAMGHLLCLDVKTGEAIWSKSFTEEYEADVPIWGFAAHPLVDGDTLYCVVGGRGSVAVAFDKKTGEERWRALSSSEPGYCPPTMIEHAGRKQLVIWNPRTLNGLDPKTGEVHWSVPLKPAYNMSVTAPRKEGDVLYASAIGNVAAAVKLNEDGTDAEILWRGTPKTAVYSSNSTPFLEDGTIYGVEVEAGALIAARLSDGKRLWETHEPTGGGRGVGHATAFLVQQGDRFFLFNEKGDLIIARLTPEGYEEIDRTHVLEPTNTAFGRDVVWSHPAFAHRSLFARNDEEIVRVDLSSR